MSKLIIGDQNRECFSGGGYHSKKVAIEEGNCKEYENLPYCSSQSNKYNFI